MPTSPQAASPGTADGRIDRKAAAFAHEPSLSFGPPSAKTAKGRGSGQAAPAARARRMTL